MLQFTTLAARDPMLHHFLANQTRRHATCSTVSRLPEHMSSTFEQFVNADDFADRCEFARCHPKSPDAKALNRKISRFVRSVGKTKPWSAQERENIKPILLAMKDRHGTASVFYTISLDDVHNVVTIRMCFPTQKVEGFPSFAGDDEEMEAEHFEKMMEALRSGGVFHVDGTGDVHFAEGQLQRLVVTNPTACSVAYHQMIEQVHIHLFGQNVNRKKTMQLFDEVDGELCLSKEAKSKNVKPGIFGLMIASADVTECSSRKALHCHGVAWTAGSPDFLSSIAANDKVWFACASALETQITGEVGLEVWIVNRLGKTLKVKGPRASFRSNSATAVVATPEAQAVREGLTAIPLQDHGCTFTCKSGFGGRWGCRFCNPAGHPVDSLQFVQLNAASKVPDTAELAGDNGDPLWCDTVKQTATDLETSAIAASSCYTTTCTAQWPGYNEKVRGDDDDDLEHITLTEPSPTQAFFSNEVFSDTDIPK